MFKTMILLFGSFISLAGLQAQTTITGRLLGHDGKPMPLANVILTKPSDQTLVKSIAADNDGNYSVAVDSAGIWILTFAGVNHSSHEVALYAEKPGTIRLDVDLKTYDYIDTVDKVGIEGSFNGFDARNPTPMLKQADGTFAADIATKGDTVAYELVGITKDGHTINGTQSDRNAYDGGGDYWSILSASKGTVRIVFDPAKLVKSGEQTKVTFGDAQSVESRFAAIYENMIKEQNDYALAASAYVESGKNMHQFNYGEYWTDEVASIAARLASETNPILHQELYVNYFWLAMFNAKLDSSIVRRALVEMPPSSVVWSLVPNTIIALSVQHFKGVPEEEQNSYAQKVLDENSDPMIKAPLLYTLCEQARFRHDSAKAEGYYTELVNKYGFTQYGKMAKMTLAPDVKISVGKTVPPFSVASLEDSTKFLTNESFKGKYYMIDFWATWCGPCVGEMEYLHKAYERFKDKNFTMLSISLDGSPLTVVEFRKGKWPMPWNHAFAGSWNDKTVKEFEVVGIPRPLLVDPSGKIVAMEEDLRGEKLEETLEQYLGK